MEKKPKLDTYKHVFIVQKFVERNGKWEYEEILWTRSDKAQRKRFEDAGWKITEYIPGHLPTKEEKTTK